MSYINDKHKPIEDLLKILDKEIVDLYELKSQIIELKEYGQATNLNNHIKPLEALQLLLKMYNNYEFIYQIVSIK